MSVQIHIKSDQMFQSCILNYQIVSSNKIVGQGSIQNIKQSKTAKNFQLYSDRDDDFQFDLKFITPSIVRKISIKLINAFRYELKLMKSENQTVQVFVQSIQGNNQKITITPHHFQEVQYVRLKIQNNPHDRKRIGISYILFQGICDQLPKITPRKDKNNKENPINLKQEQNQNERRIKLSKNPKSIESRQVFKDRERQKTPKQKLIDFSEFDQQFPKQHDQGRNRNTKNKEPQIRKKVKYNQQAMQLQAHKKDMLRISKENQDIQFAMALSRSQNIMNQAQNQQMYISSLMNQALAQEKNQEQNGIPQALQNYVDHLLAQLPDRTYDVVQLNEQYLSQFSHLTPKWLQAQRVAEIQANVRQQQRLSKYVKIKCLYNTQIYISGFPEWKVHELEHQAKQLGCKILEQIKNHCIAVVSKQFCQKQRKKHKSWNQIKFVNINYLQDCLRYKSKLKISDYYIRL